MSSLTANKVKTNVCLGSIKLFIVRIILYATIQTCTTYTTIIEIDIFLQWRSSNHDFCSHATSHKAD